MTSKQANVFKYHKNITYPLKKSKYWRDDAVIYPFFMGFCTQHLAIETHFKMQVV